MSLLPTKRRTLVLLGLLLSLLAVFIYVLLRTGPLAAVPVTVSQVQSASLSPALFGIGTVEARHTHRIGPTVAARVLRVEVDVGERVQAGQLLAEMDPVDLDSRIAAQAAALERSAAAVRAAAAQLRDVQARLEYASAQARRYAELAASGTVSAEAAEAREQERQVAEAGVALAQANLAVARQEALRLEADAQGLRLQRANLRLLAPVDGLVITRNADPGTTLVAGQALVELVDPAQLWIHVRFDQASAAGLRAGLPARIQLRSRPDDALPGRVLRVEPLADAVTEELLAKVVFDQLPQALPSIGELAEVTVALPEMEETPVVSNASIRRHEGQLGVWHIDNGRARFLPLRLGARDLDGRVQVLEGLEAGAQVVLHSQRALDGRNRIKVVERLPGVAP
jgi:RND family efflux transporter MFP subunit